MNGETDQLRGEEQYDEDDYDEEENGFQDEGEMKPMKYGDDDADEEEEPEDFELHDDVYSMFFLCQNFSHAFFFSICTFCLKLLLYTFVAVDLFGGNKGTGNLFGMPAGITTLVRMAQFFMLPVAVALQEDLIGSFALINVKYSAVIMDKCPHATYNKWVISSVVRCFDGAYSLLINFSLMLQSSEVLGLFLNFAALQFLQEIDNVAFSLGANGYLTDNIEQVTKLTTKNTLPYKKTSRYGFLDTVLFLMVYVVLLVAWSVLTARQIRGDFACQSLNVEFGSEIFGDQATALAYSGPYVRVRDNKRISARVVYQQNETDANNRRGVFGYCGDEDVWNCIITDRDPTTLSTKDFCDDNLYFLVSPGAENNFDITEVKSYEWSFRLNDKKEQVRTFQYECADA